MSLLAENFQNFAQMPAIISGRAPGLEVRLANNPREIEAAQRLRYRVFYEEMGAVPMDGESRPGIDRDHFDDWCDHLLVIDPGLPEEHSVVGTYRLMPGSRQAAAGGFYSASEFDLTPLLANGPRAERLLECGRSCVAAGYRTSRTVQLLWRGIAAYMADHDIEAMFGCASLPGTDIQQHAGPLAFMHQHALAPASLRVSALPEHAADLPETRLSCDGRRSALKALPPLIKAYLRLGAWIGEGAATDRQFRTTDVFVLLPVTRIPARYHAYFDR